MALLHSPHSHFCWLKTANVILLFCWFQSSFAYGDFYMVNSTLIYDACVNDCETSQQVDQILIGDCQRGCRLFDTLIIQNSIFAQVDEAIALPNCQRSCAEAYGSAISAVTACFDGCTNAQREYHTRSVLLRQYIRDLQRNLTFFEWFPRRPKTVNNSGWPSALKSGKSVRRSDETLNPITTPHNLNDSRLSDKSQMSFRPNLNQLPVDDQSTRRGTLKQPTTMPNWMVHSALAVFVVGVIMVLATCCYCCIFGRHHITKYMPSRSKSIDSDLPPSYEHLMRNTV
ncbi:uncharacterized protein LOC124341244 isoform X1 [Daphnia pulicaria]|uniref:uncharacterized protein LOC124341244 isoform X1 n=1 Tax=Daphnia pulicaria TaxID=35523 RepID=UPI001EECDE75|nr:uncharacterized protein LOC124341244 isoform X1 [Daphnia pulicaria]